MKKCAYDFVEAPYRKPAHYIHMTRVPICERVQSSCNKSREKPCYIPGLKGVNGCRFEIFCKKWLAAI